MKVPAHVQLKEEQDEYEIAQVWLKEEPQEFEIAQVQIKREQHVCHVCQKIFSNKPIEEDPT